MKGTSSASGQFLVNGAKSKLIIDGDSISWSRMVKGNGDRRINRLQFAQIVGQKEVKISDKISGIAGQNLNDIVRIKVYFAKQAESRSTGRLLRLKKLSIEELPAARRHLKHGQTSLSSTTNKSETAITTPQVNLTEANHGQELTAASNKSNGALQSRISSEPPSCYASEGSELHLSRSSSSSSISLTTQTCAVGVTEDDESTKSSSIKQRGQESATNISLTRLSQVIRSSLEQVRVRRPRRLLVFVNPIGGKGKAGSIYKSQVRRLLELADIEPTLLITEYANHARDTIEDPKFEIERFDGIVCVGGDGMFSELMNGLLFRYNRELLATSGLIDCQEDTNNGDSNIDNTHTTYSDPAISDGSEHLHESEKYNPREELADKRLIGLRKALGGIGRPFITPPITVGVIGAGSTDANSFGLIGTNDVTTATLNIILGNEIKIDVCSVHKHQDDALLRFVSTFVAYGYFGDVIRESEKFRWLGPSRYDVIGVNNLIKNRAYAGRVSILASSRDGSPLDPQRCHRNCRQCEESTLRRKAAGEDEYKSLKFIEKSGSFIGVNAAVTACRCPQTKKGFSPANHLANGCADLILVRPCSRMQYVNYLLRTGWTRSSAFDLKYVDAYRCRQFEFLSAIKTGDRMIGGGNKKVNSSSSSSSSTSSGCSSDVCSTSNSLNSKRSVDELALREDPTLGHQFSSWNADGEILNEQSIRVKVNNQLLRVYGTGEPSH